MSGAREVQPETTALAPEDVARANLYGLVSRLFYAPADPNLLAEIGRSGGAEEDGSELAVAWRGLQEACRGAFPPIVRQEYDSLFIGVGKAEVTPYLAGYAEPNGPDRFLVRLRDRLAGWGLGRRDRVFEVEDHISGTSDVMRWLIENGHSVSEQREFFDEFVSKGAAAFLAAVQDTPSSQFYKAVAAFAEAFLEVEQSAFEISSND